MIRTTLLYMERNGCYLMLNRDRKKNDANRGKWIGIGGHIEAGETPEQCVIREAAEETGIRLRSVNFRGIIEFRNTACDSEDMYLFTADDYEDTIPRFPDGTLADICDEGKLAYIPIGDLSTLPMWEGDAVFLKYLAEGRSFFRIRLNYEGDRLVSFEEI